MKKIKLLRGTTAQNDVLTLQAGVLTYDTERNMVRFHDGVTQGGFEIPNVPAINLSDRFLGETPHTELINGEDLSTLLNLGTTPGWFDRNLNPWLSFILDGKTLHVAKQPYTKGLTWNQLDAVNAVYGNRIETIQGKQYRIRLLKGANADPSPMPLSYEFDAAGTHGSEWNRLMYRISDITGTEPGNTLASEGISNGDWAQYTEAELGIGPNLEGDGGANWCQETSTNDTTSKLVRGEYGVSESYFASADESEWLMGWRPVLELVG